MAKFCAALTPHAHIKRVDLSKALAMDGVCAAVAGADFPAVASGVSIGEAGGDVMDVAYNVMARDKALYHGHAVGCGGGDLLGNRRTGP